MCFLHRNCERFALFGVFCVEYGRLWQVLECIWSSQNRVNRGIWEAAVPDEFGSVSVRVKSVRDVFAGKNYAELYVFAPSLRTFRAFWRNFVDLGRIRQVLECIWSSQNRVNHGIWEAAVPDEFGSVSVRVKRVRDVL